MNPTTHIEVRPLAHRPNGGAMPVTIARTEWTPKFAMCEGRSTWPQFFKGKRLTNARIHAYALEGRYGPRAKQLAEAIQLKKPLNRTGDAMQCVECKSTCKVAFRHYSYLPKAGWYCIVCVDKHRSERDKEAELRRRILAARKEYV